MFSNPRSHAVPVRMSVMVSLLVGTLFAVSIAGQNSIGSSWFVLPEWAVGTACTVRMNGAVIFKTVDRGLELMCRNPGAVVSCDGGLAEPVDIPAAEVCSSGGVRLSPATNVTVHVGLQAELNIEWLEMTRTGELARVATRAFSASPTIAFPVANAAGRLVRFVRSSASPVTVSAAVLNDGRWTLPDPRRGGELFASIQPAEIVPVGYLLRGPQSVMLELHGSPFVGIAGLPPGDYDVAPVYEGGVVGAPVKTNIGAEASTFLHLNAAQVGGIIVSSDSTTCKQPSLQLRSVATRTTAIRSILRTEVAHTSDGLNCRWVVFGLSPGTYEAELVLPSGSEGGSERFAVRAQEITDVRISNPTVQVRGELSLNGQPISGATLEFLFREPGSSPVKTITNVLGAYSITLARPGSYLVLLTDKLAPSAIREVRIADGLNTVDLRLAGGGMTVRVHGVQTDLPLDVRIDSNSASAHGEVAPGGEPIVTKYGLPFGTYYITARQSDTLLSEVKLVQLTANSAMAVADIDIVDFRSSLVLRAPNGAPVRNATIRFLRPGSSLQSVPARVNEIQPGVYTLNGLNPGTALLIRPEGFVPICRIIRTHETMYITLDVGRRIEVQLPPDITAAALAVVTLAGVPSSDCAVPLSEFRPQPVPPLTEGSRLTFRFAHFPVPNEITLSRPGLNRRVLVPDSGSVTVLP